MGNVNDTEVDSVFVEDAHDPSGLLSSRSDRERRPFFLLGVQGSGTNLTARILDKIFNFAGVLDGSLIFRSAVRVDRDPRPEHISKQFWHVYRRFFPGRLSRRLTPKHYHNARRSTGFEGIEGEFDPSAIKNGSDFAWLFYSFKARALGRADIFVKSDDLWEEIDHLRELFPRRRIVFLVRDPRDIALSISRKGFGPCDPYIAAKLVDEQLNCYRREAELASDDCITVKYETLLNRPVEFINDFRDHFGFETLENADARLAELNIRQSNFNKWKKMRPSDLAACEWVLQKHIRDFGYELSGGPLHPPSGFEALKRRASDVLLRVPQKMVRHKKSFLKD